MAQIPTSPPLIPSLPQAEARPVWSVMIPVYNCGQFLQETLLSVLEQDIPEEQMQIEVVDDASTDIDVEKLVNTIGKGRIKYYRQAHNVGSLKNFETCINRSKGKLIHLLHGDDYIEKGYYKKIGELFKKHPEAGAAFCRYRCVNEFGDTLYQKSPEMREEGILQNWLITIGERQRTQYCAITVRREVYEKLGSFFGITYAEDWVMWARIAKHYPIAYTPEMLANYRTQSNSISGRSIISGEYLLDLEKAMYIIQEYLPSERKSSILSKSKKYYANYGLKITNRLLQTTTDKQVIRTQIKNILHLHRSPTIYFKVAGIQLKLKLNRLWA